MKKYNKVKIFLLALLVMLSTGCTKYVKDGNKSVIYEATGQTLTANILCKPVTEDLYNIYKEITATVRGKWEGIWENK